MNNPFPIETLPKHTFLRDDTTMEVYSMEQLSPSMTPDPVLDIERRGMFRCPHCDKETGNAIDLMMVHLEREHHYSLIKGFPHEDEFWEGYFEAREPGVLRRVLNRIF